MKLRGFWIFLAVASAACSNELDLTTTWKDVPIVYGIISRKDSAQYIRVEKAFIDPSTSALVLAQRPDSIYYNNVTVQLRRPKRNQTIILERVDGNIEGYQRMEGIFADSPNYLYKLLLQRGEELEGGETIELTVSRGDNTTPATAKTTVLDDFTFVSGQPADILTINEYDRDVRISWVPKGEAAVYDIKIYVNIEESTGGINGTFTPKTLVWEVATNFERTDRSAARLTFNVEGRAFYNFLKNALSADASVIRRFKSIDVEVIAAGNELLEYIKIRQANTGITSSQEIPTFSNIEGGLGLFSSKNNVLKTGINITGASLDSLVDGSITRNLNFKK